MMLHLRSTTVKMSQFFLITERMLTQSVFGNLPHFILVWRSYLSVEMKRRMDAGSLDEGLYLPPQALAVVRKNGILLGGLSRGGITDWCTVLL